MNKNTTQRLIDVVQAQIGIGDPIASSTSLPLRRVDQYPAPSGIYVLSQATYRNTSTPSVLVTFEWSPPVSVPYDYFSLQISQESDFDPTETYTSVSNNASVVLKTSTTYYARVASVYKNAVSAYCSGIAFTTNADSTIPADISALTLTWSKGDLLITIPAQNVDLVKDTRIRIYNSAGTTLYKEEFALHTVRFTAEENQKLAGTSQIALQIQAQNRSWNNVYSAGTYTVNTTSPAPSGISNLSTNWNGDTGTAAADCIVTWNAENSASAYVIRVNSATTYVTTDNKFTYTWEENRRINTPSGLYTLPIAVWAINKLGQSGVLATVTHTNAAPTTTGASVSVYAGFSQISASVTHTQIDDVWQYKWTLGSQVIITTSKDVIFPAVDTGNQYVRCNIIDRFGRASSNIDSNTVYLEPLTISGLRATLRYTDSQSTSPATLAGLKDDDLTTNVISHTNTTASSRWTQGERDLIDRVKTITLSANGSMRFYFTTSDGVTTRYFAGPLTSGRVLTEYASQALAESNYLTYDGTTRYDFPSLVEARIFRLYHWISSGTYYLREFYPRRLIQSDDIEAESIKGINVAALAITADKISVTNLSAITANLGTVTAGTISGLTILGGEITGATLQTAYTGSRIKITGYSGIQVFASNESLQFYITDGVLTTAQTLQKTRISASGIVLDPVLDYGGEGGPPLGTGSSIRVLDGAQEITTFYTLRMLNSDWYTTRLAGNPNGLNVRNNIDISTQSTGAKLGLISLSVTGPSGSNYVLINVSGVSIGAYATPTATLDVSRGTLTNGTARFVGTTYASHFNYSTNENTYIRGGKINSNIYIGDAQTTGSGSTLVYGGTGGLYAYSNNTLCFTVNQYGNMGVGTAPGQYTKLNSQAGGTSSTYYAFIATNSTPSNLMILRADGYSWINQNWTVGSSQANKRNIEDLTLQDAIKIFQNLRPRKYNLLESTKKHFGLVLEEMPMDGQDLVEDQGIRYGDLIAPMLLVMRYLYQQIQQLQATLNARNA